MKKQTIFLCSTLCGALLWQTKVGLATEQPKSAMETNRIIVKLKKDTPQEKKTLVQEVNKASEQATKENKVKEAVVKKTNTGAQVIQTEMMNTKEQKEVLQQLRQCKEVAYVEADQWMEKQATSSDLASIIQRHDKIRQYQWHLAACHIPEVWKEGYTGKGITVGINDSGYAGHSQVDGNYLGGYDFISQAKVARDHSGRDANPNDEGDWIYNQAGKFIPSSWHGTHVAGLVAAPGKAENSLTGVAFQAKFTMGRSLGAGGGYMSDIADAFAWLGGLEVAGVPKNTHPAQVINASLGSKPYPSKAPISRTYQETFERLYNKGVVVVVAAGNDAVNANRVIPANTPHAIVVGSFDAQRKRSSFSNWGEVVDVYAPGTMLLSSVNTGSRTKEQEAEGFMSGTSMAAPVVSGVVALMLEKNPKLRPTQVEMILRDTAKNVIDPSTRTMMKQIDAQAAIAKVNAATKVKKEKEKELSTTPAFEKYYKKYGGKKHFGRLLKVKQEGDFTYYYCSKARLLECKEHHIYRLKNK